MRLGCPNCGALYEVAEAAIPPTGREIECSACAHRWFHRPPTPDLPPEARSGAAPASPAAPAGGRGEVPPPRPTDPAVLQILREEASRELAARRREASAPAPRDADPADPPAQPRRALLPEIEADGPVLRPTAGTAAGAGTIVLHPGREPAGGSFATGFVAALLLAALAAAAYLWSAELTAAVPALADPLDRFVAGIDALRSAIAAALG